MKNYPLRQNPHSKGLNFISVQYVLCLSPNIGEENQVGKILDTKNLFWRIECSVCFFQLSFSEPILGMMTTSGGEFVDGAEDWYAYLVTFSSIPPCALPFEIFRLVETALHTFSIRIKCCKFKS